MLKVMREIDRTLWADGDVIELKKLCKQLKRSAGGSAANVLSGYKDGNGRTCFHFAAFEGREQVCEYILSEAGDR